MSGTFEGFIRPFTSLGVSPPRRLPTSGPSKPHVITQWGGGGSPRAVHGNLALSSSVYTIKYQKESPSNFVNVG